MSKVGQLLWKLKVNYSKIFGMGKKTQAQGLPATVFDQEGNAGNSTEILHANNQPPHVLSNAAPYRWWLAITIFITFALSGQSVATLLGRLYFEKGGNSKWMAALVQTAGFPVLLPFLFLYRAKEHTQLNNRTHKPPLSILVSLYLFLGILLAAMCMLYTFGLAYVPVSTFSLICASQLAFNAFFSYFLNAQKFTAFISNSLVLLTVSSTLLVFQNDQRESSSSSTISKKNYAIGFICTVAASSSNGFLLALTERAFKKILKTQSVRAVIDLTIYQSLFGTLAILIGFFASGEWKGISAEVEGYKQGKVSYVMTLVWTAVFWQVYFIGSIGLIYKVSSLFANVISAVGLPIVPVFAVIFFHDKVNGVKVIALLLAIWGFISYIYQHYLDDLKAKAEAKDIEMNLPLQLGRS